MRCGRSPKRRDASQSHSTARATRRPIAIQSGWAKTMADMAELLRFSSRRRNTVLINDRDFPCNLLLDT